MDIRPINNAIEIDEIDLEDDEQCRELGRTVAHECVALVRQGVPEERLYEIHTLWGQPCRAIIHKYVGEKRLTGRHWRNLLANLGHISNAVDHISGKTGMSRVSFQKNEKGKPTGVFTNGELDWHSDQQAYHDSQRIVGLMSLWGSQNSQTAFLCTAPAYEALNSEDRSMVDELVTVWDWDGGSMSRDLIPSQKEIVRYNMIPYPKMECALVDRTATGRAGIRFPSHCFSHFRGMSREESMQYRAHLWSLLDRPDYIYTHDWTDGEIVFMDQNITLHARPTNVRDGDSRTMSRMISYVDKLFPGHGPADHVLYDGKKYDHETFAHMVDEQRRREFYEQDGAHYPESVPA
ncbi:MAG: TauD/TfdA dioxygenase family protein [Parasphingopyxis sp.]|uniref:TauD/TfdA dioxygenase family protein n=1 Tax=Parasphingopyxis sp. TaxID=1920299 RepID=UPI003F9EEBC5